MHGISRLVIATVGIVAMFVIVLIYSAVENDRLDTFAANFEGRDVEAGADLYFQACASCHGQHGEGLVGPALNAADLLVPEPGQTRPPRLIAKNYTGDLRSYLEGAITYGRVGTVMPVWGDAAGGPFRADQVSSLASFIMNWGLDPGKQWGGAPPRTAIGGVEPVEVAAPSANPTPPPRDVQSAALGQYMFEGPAGCTECHTINGAGGTTGPALDGVVQAKGRDYVHDAIVNPENTVAAGHAPGAMPETFNFSMTDIEIESIIDYLEDPAAAGPAPSAGEATPAPAGELDGQQVATSAGCVACHSLDGSVLVGPTWKGLYGKTEEFEDGSTGTADDAYLHESIVNPAAKIVKGFTNLMPAIYSQTLTEDQIAAIIEYIKTLQ